MHSKIDVVNQDVDLTAELHPDIQPRLEAQDVENWRFQFVPPTGPTDPEHGMIIHNDGSISSGASITYSIIDCQFALCD